MKKICYCADDYALNNEISHAVRILLKKNAIQATSCMSQSPIWQEQAHHLIQLKRITQHHFEIGLHLNFTHAFPQHHYPVYGLYELIIKAWLRMLNRDQIRYSIEQQWDFFVQGTGQVPDFIDGHQHIHQFPVIREVLFTFLKEKNFKGWVRSLKSTIYSPNEQFKNKLLSFLGATQTLQLAQENQIPSNLFFSGIYDFKALNYAELNREWLRHAQNGLLIMCHPATCLPKKQDEIQNARIQEYEYLNSEKFLQDCNQFDIQRQPLGAIL